MESFLKYFVDFKSIQKFIDKSDKSFKEALIDYFLQLGLDLGFDAKKDYSFEAQGLKFPSIDVVWLNGKQLFAAIEIEFSSKDDFLAALMKLSASMAEYSTIITSSNSNVFKIDEAEKLLPMINILNTYFLLIDITKEQYKFVH